MSYYGIKREEGRLGSLKIGTKAGASEVLTGSATEVTLQNVDYGTITSFTASYAKITTLDVNTINSITTTTQSLEVADALIVAASGANSLAANNGGLQIGGTAGSDTVASFLYDADTVAMEINFAGVTAVEVVSGSAFRPDTDDLYDLGGMGREWRNLYIDGIANIDDLRADQLGAALDANNQSITNINVDSGDISGADITVGTGKTLDVSGGTLTLGDDQISGDSIQGGTIGSTTITTLTSTTVNATNVSASGYVSASSFEVDGQASISYDASALDFSSGGAGAKLSTTMFSASVELQGPTMEVSGAAKVGSLTIGGTAVTATAAEINYLDNSDLTAADITKLAALDATAAEINILDGNTSATSTIVADADRLVLNDNGTMVQVAMTDFETYFESALDTLPNVTTVGALDAGSITSGFGNVNIGTSTLNAGAMSASVGVSGSEGQFGDLKLAEQESGKYGNQHVLFMSNGDVTSNGSFQIDDTGDFTVQSPKFKTEMLEVSSGGDRIQLLSELSGAVALSSSALILDSTTKVTSILDEDNMASNSATALATQQSIKAYVDQASVFAIAGDSGTDNVTVGTDTLTFAGTSNEIVTAVTDNTVTVSLPDDVTIGNNLTLGSDDAILNFGADSDVNLTHVADTGLLLNAGMQLQFRDSAIHISSDADGYLNAQADTGVNLNIGGTDVLAVTSAGATVANNADLLAGGAACDIGSSLNPFANVYATNVITGDFHMKNERGDWTLFEESDHIRIRNNKTGQTFKMGMTLIEE